MLRLSTLLSKLDFSTMGDLRADLVGEAERLEAIEETFIAINRECEKADVAPTAVDGVQLDCEIEWAIYGTGGNVWLSFRGGEYTWRDAVYHAKRFASKKDAQSYIKSKDIAAIPFPVPKIKEAK